ncbi:MAG: SagB/ThcOx family dehydrogenase, partial [Promethearchaeota archaeon]
MNSKKRTGDPGLEARIGDAFQELTKYERGKLPAHGLDPAERPVAYKQYMGSRVVPLPEPTTSGGMGAWDAIRERRSHRLFADQPMTLEEVSQLLWAAQGVTARAQGFAFRAAPSAGGLYPVETYACVRDVSGVEEGVYHYDVLAHALELVETGDHAMALARAALDQAMVLRAQVTFVWT